MTSTDRLPDDALVSEIFQKVSNAKTKAEKISLLKQFNKPEIKQLLIWNFDDSVKSALPEGSVPYVPNPAPIGTEHSRLAVEYRKLYYFVVGGDNTLSNNRRETMFIQLLEGLSAPEAEVLCLVKDKILGKRYKITKNVVEQAFPQIQWGNRS